MRTRVAGATPPSRTSASPCLENGWIAVSRGGVETIRFESCHISGGKCLDLSLLERRIGRNGERPQCREERQGGSLPAHMRPSRRNEKDGFTGRGGV